MQCIRISVIFYNVMVNHRSRRINWFSYFQELTKRNIEVIGLDSSEVNIFTRFPAEKIINGDIRDVELLRSIFDAQEIEGIIHCATPKSVPESILIPDSYMEINFVETKDLVNLGVKRMLTKLISFLLAHLQLLSLVFVTNFLSTSIGRLRAVVDCRRR